MVIDLLALRKLAAEEEARWANATGGTWLAIPQTNRHALWQVSTDLLDEGTVAIGCYEVDAIAIAASRTSGPVLAAALREAAAEIERLHADAAGAPLSFYRDEVERLHSQAVKDAEWRDFAMSENLAFNVKASQQINEARMQRDEARAQVERLVADVDALALVLSTEVAPNSPCWSLCDLIVARLRAIRDGEGKKQL